ncbi:hypothetical protein EIP86_008968 [Pleurotus ostreatoroseus]|nr:hypothetical protein EIP86_008968 [Pleurotus ostreatoroseus]
MSPWLRLMMPRVHKVGQTVWIRLQETWYRGTVRRIIQTEQSQDRNLRYDVHFRHWNCTTNMKACFDPLNGNIKPDTPRIRTLLREAGATVGSANDA